MFNTDFSTYTLRQLFEARYWIDPAAEPFRSRYLESEINRRCTYIWGRTNREGLVARFRPYGFIFGVAFLACSIGPYAAAEFCAWIKVPGDPQPEPLTLSGVWALITCPFAVLAFMIGGIADAGRIVEWFNLAGVKAEVPRPVWPDLRQIAGLARTVLRRALRPNEVSDLTG